MTNESLYELTEAAGDLAAEFIEEHAKEVKPTDIGLSNQIHGQLYVMEDGVACKRSNRQSLEYYGGFEYVGDEHVNAIGDWVFYSAECQRVLDCVERIDFDAAA